MSLELGIDLCAGEQQEGGAAFCVGHGTRSIGGDGHAWQRLAVGGEDGLDHDLARLLGRRLRCGNEGELRASAAGGQYDDEGQQGRRKA